MRQVAEAVIALSSSPNGFTASQLAGQVQALSKQRPSDYGARRAAYDLKKLCGKKIVRRIGRTRRYESLPKGLRAMAALVVLRNQAIKPLLAAAQNPKPLDTHYDTIRTAMRGVFQELGLVA
jgi:repressor of nif and glnA expression